MGTKYTGRDVKIGIAKEASRGTPTAATYWIPRRSSDFEDKATVIIDDQTYGVIEDSVDAKVVNKYAEGSISGLVRDKAIGLFLLNALGSATPVASSTPYTHTFVVGQSHQHPSLTIEVDEPTVGNLAYPLAMLSSLEIVADLNEFVLFTVNFMAQTGTSTPVTAAYVAENNFTANEMLIKFAATQSDLAAASETKVKSVTFTIEKELEKDDILGSISPDDFLNKTVRITLAVTRNYEDTDFRDLFISGSPKAMRFEMESATVMSDNDGGVAPKLTIDLNQVKITDWVTAKDLDGINTETFTVKANFKIADSKMVAVTLINNVSGY